MTDYPIDDMLKDYGITNKDSQRNARIALFTAGIIQKTPDRANIACDKINRARETLTDQFRWHCNNGECRRIAGEIVALPLLLVEQHACSICQGNPSSSKLDLMADVAIAAGKRRIAVVGGTEKKEREIRRKSPQGMEWRFIDGSTVRDGRYYRAHRQWADIIIIWQSTPLDHRVSSHFDGKGDDRVITVRRRGIDCLANEIMRYCRTR